MPPCIASSASGRCTTPRWKPTLAVKWDLAAADAGLRRRPAADALRFAQSANALQAEIAQPGPLMLSQGPAWTQAVGRAVRRPAGRRAARPDRAQRAGAGAGRARRAGARRPGGAPAPGDVGRLPRRSGGRAPPGADRVLGDRRDAGAGGRAGRAVGAGGAARAREPRRARSTWPRWPRPSARAPRPSARERRASWACSATSC